MVIGIKFPSIVHVPMHKSIKKVIRIKHNFMITQLQFSSTSPTTAIIKFMYGNKEGEFVF